MECMDSKSCFRTDADVPMGQRLHRFEGKLFVVAILLLAMLGLSCVPYSLPDLTDGNVRVFVSMSGGPVVGAKVKVWWLQDDGTLVSNDVLESVTGRDIENMPPLDSGETNSEGFVNLAVGRAHGTLLIVAIGGEETPPEPWIDATYRVADGVVLRTVLLDYIPYKGRMASAVVSPLTTLAVGLAEARLTHGKRELVHGAAMRRAHELLSEHFGGVDLTRTYPEPVTEPTFLTSKPPVYFLMLVALSYLARDIANASGIPAEEFSPLDLVTTGLINDAFDEDTLFNGTGPDGPVIVAECVPETDPAEDPEAEDPEAEDPEAEDPEAEDPEAEDPEESTGMDHALCDLDSNTLRSHLAQSLASGLILLEQDEEVVPSFKEIRLLIERIANNRETELFGPDAPIPVKGPPPLVEVEHTEILDESGDEITFTDAGVPVHQHSGEVIELGVDGQRPTVYKYVHRLDHADDNLLHFRFSVQDRSGAGIDVDAARYRVRFQFAPATEWLPAKAIRTADDVVLYEVVLTERAWPKLGTKQGLFEIEFRGYDKTGTASAVARRQWVHVPLSVPLQLISCQAADGPGSLHSVDLFPSNNLAPYLNGVPLEEGLALLECELRNGTAERAYLSLRIEQPSAMYQKSWRKTNVFLVENPASECLKEGLCMHGTPPDRKTTVSNDETGVIHSLASGILLVDSNTNERVVPCDNCESDQYVIESRFTPEIPRTYKLWVVATDLNALAPHPVGEDLGPFIDVPLDLGMMPIPITGRSYGRLRICRTILNDSCEGDHEYAHYLALTNASLSLPWLRVHGQTTPALSMAPVTPFLQPNTFGMPVEIEDYEWSTSEELLPLPVDP